MQHLSFGARFPGRHWGLRLRTLALATGVLLFLPAFRPQDDSGYRTFDQMTNALRRVVRGHSDIARMESLGETLEGRDIWMVEIANRQGAPVAERPGLLIVANLEGDRLVGSEIAVRTIDYLLTNYDSDAAVKEQLDNHVFYVVPRLNPDAAELMFANLKSDRRTNATPYDDDNDARVDEDGPDDLNGDGLISVMRVADPSGAFMVHPDNPRLMKRADAAKGESGDYEVYWEGIDDDGDGFYNEDGVGGIDMNRNFQHEYPYYEPGAGHHMVSELESRALMDFVISHRNIAAVLTLGANDNLVNSPTSTGALAAAAPIGLHDFAAQSNADARGVGMFQVRQPGGFFGFGMFPFGGQQQQQAPTGRRRPVTQPATTVDEADREYFNAVGSKYREITGVSDVAGTRAPKGAFFEYAYYHFGVPSFSTPGWGLGADDEEAESGAGAEAAQPDAPRARPQPPQRQHPGAMPAGGIRMQRAARPGAEPSGGSADTDARLLEWMDENEVDGFVDWQEYQHPTLGTVEIGGFKPYATSNPPASALAELGESHGEFAVYLASQLPQVRIADVQVTNHGGGVFEIEAEIENAGFLPTSMQQGVRARSVAPTMVQLGVDPDDLLTGAAKTSFIRKLDGSGARETFNWVIRGQPGSRIELKVRAQKGGTTTQTITLR